MTEKKAYIGVIGAGICDLELFKIAEDVGRNIGKRKGIIVCGGLGGVMEAACKGAKEAGGTTIGILPTTGRKTANAFVDYAFPTGLGEGRNFLIARFSDVVIAVGGEYGTLSEIGLSLKMGKKVIGLKTWELIKDGKKDLSIIEVSSAEKAVEIAFNYLTF
ncbi:MAG: TIGR00725 family protein [Actinomycetia bacterium]|nr:TIGR00725 family protein [Actinomycetes bacterium]